MKKERKQKISFMLNNLVKAGILTDWRTGGAGVWFLYYTVGGVPTVAPVHYYSYKHFCDEVDSITDEVLRHR